MVWHGQRKQAHGLSAVARENKGAGGGGGSAWDSSGVETTAAAVRRSGMGGLQRLGHGWRGGGGYGNHGG